jgi:hypothetical protein
MSFRTHKGTWCRPPTSAGSTTSWSLDHSTSMSWNGSLVPCWNLLNKSTGPFVPNVGFEKPCVHVTFSTLLFFLNQHPNTTLAPFKINPFLCHDPGLWPKALSCMPFAFWDFCVRALPDTLSSEMSNLEMGPWSIGSSSHISSVWPLLHATMILWTWPTPQRLFRDFLDVGSM